MLGFLGQRKRVHFYFVPRPDPSILWRKRGASLSGLERRGNELRALSIPSYYKRFNTGRGEILPCIASKQLPFWVTLLVVTW